MAFVDYVYRQLAGFAKAGTRLQPAITNSDKIISRIIAAVLILIAVGTIVLVQFYAHLTLRVLLLLAVFELPLMGYIYSFLRGVSINWLLGGLWRYRLPVVLLLILLASLAYIFIQVFITRQPNNQFIILLCGAVMALMAFFMATAFWGRARAKTDKANKLLSWISVLLWLGFLAAGIVTVWVGISL